VNLTSKDAVSGDARQLRRLNLERLLSLAMDQPGAFTRAELIRQTSLSAPTVGSLTGTLIHRGLLLDLGTGPSRGGRRPGLMEFNARYGVVLGIVLGVQETQMAIADLRGELLVERSQQTPTRLGPTQLLAWIAEEARALLRRVEGPRARLVAVAAGAPGAVDAREGRVVALAPNLRGWSGVSMGSTLRKHLGAPVLLDNDVNLAILGERWRGAARGHDTCAFIAVGPGIGAGIVVEGVLHRGHHFLAGEIALMCMGPEYVDRDFGQRGCLETLANLTALESHWREAGHDGGGPSVFTAARQGDEAARRVIGDTATLLGIAATNLSLVLDPSLLVFGGPMLPDGEMLVDEVAQIVRRIIPSPPKIVASELGEQAPLWGAILVAASEARRRLRAELSAVPSPDARSPRGGRGREKARPRLASR
jgi:predicted NBD/HSP70 family sugar kinase